MAFHSLICAVLQYDKPISLADHLAGHLEDSRTRLHIQLQHTNLCRKELSEQHPPPCLAAFTMPLATSPPPHLSCCVYNATGDHITLHDSTKDVDQQSLHLRVCSQDLECFNHLHRQQQDGLWRFGWVQVIKGGRESRQEKQGVVMRSWNEESSKQSKSHCSTTMAKQSWDAPHTAERKNRKYDALLSGSSWPLPLLPPEALHSSPWRSLLQVRYQEVIP